MYQSPAYGTGSYYDTRQPLARKRTLYAPKDKLDPFEARELLKGLRPGIVLELVTRAGQEALRCSGPGWLPKSDVRVVPSQGKPLVLQLAGFKRLELSVNPAGCLARCAHLHKAGAEGNPFRILENAAGALVRLFAGYYGICPWDAWRHRDLVQAALWRAYRSYWVSKKESELAMMVALFFERSIVAHALTELEGALFVNGLAYEQAISQTPHHLLTALFVRTQSLVFPKAWSHALKNFPPEPDPVADALLEEAMFILFNGRVRFIRGRLVLRGRPGRPKSWDWANRVELLADLLIPYLERQQNDQGTGPNPNPFVPPDGPGLPPPGIGQPLGPIEGLGPNPFVGQSDVTATGAQYDLLPQDGGLPLSTLSRREPRFNDYETIDRYYTERAKALVVRDKTDDGPKREQELVTVGYLDHQEASVLDLVSGQIDWARCRIGESDDEHPRGLYLFRRTEPYDVPAQGGNPAPMGLPHLFVAVDSSGSMRFDPGASGAARGKYDLVLMAAWGMLRHIQGCPNVRSVKVNALNFSGATSASGWHPCTALEPVKRVLATYKGGGTTLDVAKLREAFDTSPGEFLTVIITDGQLSNTVPAVQGFGEIVRAGNHVILLHIGRENEFTKGIRNLGCPVHLLEKAEDLVGLCLDLARDRYARDM